MKDEKKQSLRKEKTSKWRKFARKRWVYPAIYIGAAAIIIATVLWMQRDTGDYSIDKSKEKDPAKNSIVYNKNNEATPVNKTSEVFKFPVKNKDAVEIQKQFYDDDASTEKKEAALVLHNHTYRQNTGIDVASESGKSFTVTASMSGEVVQAGKDPSFGNVVAIDNGDGVTTLYQSLKDLAVKAGDTVTQGQKLGMAGTSEYNSKAGTHLHFEIRKDKMPLNPVKYFEQAKSDLPNEDKDNMDKMDQKNNENPEMKDDQKDQSETKDDQGTSGEEDQDQDTGNDATNTNA